MKVTIIGGAGRVGSTAAYALQLGGVVNEIALVDVAADVAGGEALDLRHGASLSASQKFSGGGYECAEGSDIIIVTAGLRRKPDESRLQLINRNVSLFKNIMGEVAKLKLPENWILFVVANPVDILTRLGKEMLGLPANRAIGLGTVLDSSRFRSLIADHFNINPTQVDALILGEHGDSMIPVWSSANVNGTPLACMPGFSEEWTKEIFDFTKKSGAEVIRLKGGAGYAVGLSIKIVTEAIALDKKSVLPISSYQTGALGISDVCLSIPTIVGKNGAEQVLTPKLTETETAGLQNSAKVLKDIYEQIEK